MPDFVVILRPGPAVPPAGRRLARALKFAGRGCALRCVHVDEIEPADVAGLIGAMKEQKRRRAAAHRN